LKNNFLKFKKYLSLMIAVISNYLNKICLLLTTRLKQKISWMLSLRNTKNFTNQITFYSEVSNSL
jgi:hypothetical protein